MEKDDRDGGMERERRDGERERERERERASSHRLTRTGSPVSSPGEPQ